MTDQNVLCFCGAEHCGEPAECRTVALRRKLRRRAGSKRPA